MSTPSAGSAAAARYAIGIDLGTTHSALSWVDLAASDGETTVHGVLPLPQLTAPGTVEALPLLPSFLYLPHADELAPVELALLQRDARLIDFAGESLAAYDDAQIGAAARLVHEGCAKVLREQFDIVPVRAEAEGTRITLAAGFDAAAIKLTGNVVGQPPFSGSLSHRGWRVAEVRLPKLAEGHDARVLAPAEVEL